jgi:hypothetical protein
VGRVEQDKKPTDRTATIDVTFWRCTQAAPAAVSKRRGGSTIAPPDERQRLENDP